MACLPEVRWGEHACQFYRTAQDLESVLVPFFAEGLRHNERCVWITAEPLHIEEARAALRVLVPDLDAREQAGQIELYEQDEWYIKNGQLGPDEVIAGWLHREAEALRAGYAGLRISGNTSFLLADQWDAFADYEARCHRAFASRRILAICSYVLDQCSDGKLLDVLRSHSVALVRDRGRSHALHSATAVMAYLEGEQEPALRGHTVEVFADAEFPAEALAQWLAASLDRGEAAGALARGSRLDRLATELARHGIDVSAESARDRLVLINADRVFEAASANPGLREAPIVEQVLAPIARALDRYRRARVYGELVDLFASAGDHDGAVALERWWHRQICEHAIELRCGYTRGSFAGSLADLRRVCGVHEAMVPGRGGTSAELVLAERDVLLEAVQPVREHLSALQRVTSELGMAATYADIGEVVNRECRAGFGASKVSLAIARPSGWFDIVARHAWSFPVPDGERLVHLATARAILAAQPALTAVSPHAVTVVPLVARERAGVLVLGYESERDLDLRARGLLLDIAKQIAHALDRARLYEAVEAASRAKDEFFAMLGHELRNPLAPILTAVQLMRLRGEDHFVKERTVIERQANHLVRLVEDLLDVSRIARGKVELQRRPAELASIIAQAVEQASPALEAKQHHLEVRIPSGIAVDADVTRLAQVFANVIGNAVKFTPEGGRIHITAAVSGARIAVAVKDNGRGIERELLPTVFDLFVQGRQGLDRAQGGLGLGLAIAKQLVELHGGSIRAKSEGPGRGSTFTIELPTIADVDRAASSISSDPAVAANPNRVLVVDDNRDAADMIADALRSLGYAVDVAYDAPAALELARNTEPRIAILDLGLPGMDGFELAAALRARGSEDLRVVAVSGYGQTADRARCSDAGFAAHFVKPVSISALNEVLATF